MSDLVGSPEDRFSHNEAQIAFNNYVLTMTTKEPPEQEVGNLTVLPLHLGQQSPGKLYIDSCGQFRTGHARFSQVTLPSWK